MVPTAATAPTAATDGQSITVNWQVEDRGSSAATGSWQDSVYISPTPTITSSSILLGTEPHTGGLAANATYDGTLTTALPALSPGYYYILVDVDSLYQAADVDRANNTLAATTGQLDISVPALSLGTALNGSFTAAGQDHYFQVTVPAGGSLSISLASNASSGAVALYVSQGVLPTPYNYQESSDGANEPSQALTVPQVESETTYYIEAESIAGSAATSNFTITASQTSKLAVTGISPTAGGNLGSVTVEIDGTNFTSSTTARLTHSGGLVEASAVDFVSASQIFATFNLSTSVAGAYLLTVEQGGQSVNAQTLFQVLAAGPAPITVALSVPEDVRPGRSATVVISYANESEDDVVAPLLTVSSTNADTYFSTPDNPNNYMRTAQVLAVAASGPAGILRPGESGQLTLTVLSDDTVAGDQISVQVGQLEPGQTIDWASQEAALQPSTIPTAAWNVIFGNLIATLGSTTDSYDAALAQAATYLGSWARRRRKSAMSAGSGPFWCLRRMPRFQRRPWRQRSMPPYPRRESCRWPWTGRSCRRLRAATSRESLAWVGRRAGKHP